jgi:predicted transcriptional regulator
VRQALAEQGRELAHTSVITTLNTMVAKQYLKRTMDGNACLFTPKLTRAKVSQRMLGAIVDRVFDGSAKAVLLSLFDCADLDDDDLRELRQLIQQRSGRTRKSSE